MTLISIPIYIYTYFNTWLVVWNMLIFSIIYGTILPIDELHHFSRWLKHVKTSNQLNTYLKP